MATIIWNGVEREETPEEETDRLALFADMAPPSPFLPIEPVPFWKGAFDLFNLKKSDVLNAIEDEDERYKAELEIEGRKTYLRGDPWVVSLAAGQNIEPERMDTAWIFVQENYK